MKLLFVVSVPSFEPLIAQHTPWIHDAVTLLRSFSPHILLYLSMNELVQWEGLAKTELNNKIYYYFETTMTDHDSWVKLENFSPATWEYQITTNTRGKCSTARQRGMDAWIYLYQKYIASDRFEDHLMDRNHQDQDFPAIGASSS